MKLKVGDLVRKKNHESFCLHYNLASLFRVLVEKNSCSWRKITKNGHFSVAKVGKGSPLYYGR